MIKRIKHLLLSAAITCLSVSPLLAATGSGTPPADVAAWVNRVNLQIDDVLRMPQGVRGVAQVTFRRGIDGRPTDIRLADSPPRLAAAARRMLAHLDLPPMPAGIDPQQRITLQLLFDDGSNMRAYEQRRGAMLAAASRSNARLAVHQDQAFALAQ